MELNWYYDQEEEMTIKDFLSRQGLPRAFMRDIKYSGQIMLNHIPTATRFTVRKGDHIKLIAPIEYGHDSVKPSLEPINIVFEDKDLLILNKPVGVVSIPSMQNPSSSMANRVRGYYQQRGYQDQVIHIVTRLDRDTSGLMIIAKHRLAHALMDRQVRNQKVYKFYNALSSRIDWEDHGVIEAAIARAEDSLISRRVHETGKYAKTEFWCLEQFASGSHLRLRLHTGRTHQIRVHLSYKGGPLIGDDLYGGPHSSIVNRQALHCGELRFKHPFTEESLIFKASLPDDMQEWITEQQYN
ncbi:RluA family pseudouridine synthase [Facklamia sp. DSM 111018]|uniref:Pseudouridine synthase n=1 Tax=Facklamia lactis TaxID=2749967 RepID=A0ABS0LRE6_9LACT|nr:RluA family pseudouridine synthase [Facklamia lactis]MBG9980901.1 RluA family pseudouridine synthase [Facklamia lactis]MBG9986736.1 RluA family pseudouridine synthase [Facklamia lactis]